MFSVLDTGNISPTVEKGSKPNLQYPPSPKSSLSSGSSFDQDDDENITVTSNRLSKQLAAYTAQEDDLRVLAISTHMTELSYAISDIQTRIFEIQELRHKSQSSDGGDTGTTTIIDQSLMNLNERMESVSNGMKTVNDSLEPVLQSSATPTMDSASELGEEMAMILRKHATLSAEWAAVQDDSDTLKEELKEDKWLTVFRTVTDQADGMMSSLEKAVNRCQDFLWQAQRRGLDELLLSSTGTTRSEKSPFETFNSLLESFEAKKKHYMPATSKVLSIIDKGVKDRVTKNGETLRRHAESAARWKNLRERISRTDVDMQQVKRVLLGVDGSTSEAGSSTSGLSTTTKGYLATPVNARSPSSNSISRSISPLRKFARKFTQRNATPPVTPLKIYRGDKHSLNGTKQKQRGSILGSFRSSQPSTPITPDRPNIHKYSHSVTPESAPRSSSRLDNSTSRSSRMPWNSSTRIDPTASPPTRPPSAAGRYADGNPITSSPYKRSTSRASMASSRPWSPVTSSISTTQSSSHLPPSSSAHRSSPTRSRTPSRPAPPPPRTNAPSRPPSRSRASHPQPPARAPSRTRGFGISASAPTPAPVFPSRARPETPSHIPGPSTKLPALLGPSSDGGSDDGLFAALGRASSPTFSVSAASGAGGSPSQYPPRPPSRSMIPLPSVSLSTPSRPGTSMSMSRAESPTTAFRHMANRAQTPESALRTRLQSLTIHQGPPRAGRASLNKSGPPSSFRPDQSVSRPPSRSTSRMSAYGDQLPIHEYVPLSSKDPLDMEVAAIVNSIPHGLLIERMDPPLRKPPKEGQEVKAQYSFANALSGKVITCKLTTLVRTSRAANTGESTTVINKKVMCRVGGGWQDLSHYVLNRQAGI